MAIEQIIWSLDEKKKLRVSTLADERELEQLIYDNIEVISDNWIVIGRQVATGFGGLIDLLCLDFAGNTIVVELKKGRTPREVTAQALDYASCVKNMSLQELAEIYTKKCGQQNTINQAYKNKFGKELDEDNANTETSLVIVASQMDASTERIVNYLRDFGLDINVLFFNVFEHKGQRFLSRAWLIEGAEDGTGELVKPPREWNGEYYVSFGTDNDGRVWADAVKYGFICAGGGSWYTKTLEMLKPGDRVWVNIPGKGYVGVGRVTETVVSTKDAVFDVDGQKKKFPELDLQGKYNKDTGEETEERLVKVAWVAKVEDENKAVKEIGFFGNQNTVCRPTAEKWNFTVDKLKSIWKVE